MTHNPVQRFRQRKLSTRQSLLVLRQNEIDSPLEDGTQRHIPRVETGVEKGEEIVRLLFHVFLKANINPLRKHRNIIYKLPYRHRRQQQLAEK